MDAMQFLRGVENPMQPYALPHLGLSADALRNRTAAQIIAGAQAQYADTMARAPFYIRYTLESLLQSFDDLNELSAALGVPVEVLAQQLASDPDQERQAYQAQLDAQREAQRIENERVAYAQMLADIERQGREEQARIDAYIAQTQAEVAAFEANFQAMLAEQARLEATRQAALQAEQEAAARAQFEADNAQRLALAAELQRIAESGSVPVEAMIATGQFTQAQIDLATRVQAGQLATQQEATRLDLARQEAEQRAKVDAELAAQAQAQAQAIAEEQAAIEAYMAQEQAAGRAALEAQPIAKGTDMERYVFADFTLPQGWYQFTGAQKADWFNQNNVTPSQLKNAGVPDEDIAALRQEGYVVQDVVSDTSQSAFNAQMQALQDNVIEIWTARADGRSYALPVWSIQYSLIPADVVENWLASFGLPTIAELEAELAASQAAAPGVDVSRGIDATSVVTAPAAPSDTVFPDTSSLVALPGDADSYAQPVVTAPTVVTPAVVTPAVVTPTVVTPTVVTPAVTPLIALPDDWDTYSDTRKIAWFNANQIKPSQLIAAGVPASDIAYMRANGYIVQEQAPAAGGYGLLLALASAYFLGA